MAWMLLWRATVAAPLLEKLSGGFDPEARKSAAEKNKNAAFYEGQIRSAEFFIQSVLPITYGKMKSIMGSCSAAVEIPEVSFGG